jgi:hypothetical protein
MATLTGSTTPASLGGGYFVLAPGIRGSADAYAPPSSAERGRSRGPRDGMPELDAALEGTNVTQVRDIELDLRPAPRIPATSTRSTAEGRDTIDLLVPDLGPDVGQLVLSCDDSGIMTWHFPVPEEAAPAQPRTRGATAGKRFRIPAESVPPGSAGAAPRTRGLVGVVGRKLLKVLVYPVTDPVIGSISEVFAERWEQRHRPYGLRRLEPATFRSSSAPELNNGDWDHLRGGRALLFVHGTFSTAHGAFNLIPDDAFALLSAAYEGRLFAFNHFTLSHDPRQNIEWLLKALPPGSLEVDIVCHSRGGLVARTLCERPSVFGLDTSRISVRRVVFVGVPNDGTLLAHPDHMVKMIDRLTSVLNLFPTGPVTETLEAMITALKMIGHGALKGLPGLASMCPGGEFLKKLNEGSPAGGGYHAIAADYEPTDGGLKALVAESIADGVLDQIFESAGNDLVVPEAGVYGANGSLAFPIPDERVLRVPAAAGVMHTTFFGHQPTWSKLSEWLAV